MKQARRQARKACAVNYFFTILRSRRLEARRIEAFRNRGHAKNCDATVSKCTENSQSCRRERCGSDRAFDRAFAAQTPVSGEPLRGKSRQRTTGKFDRLVWVALLLGSLTSQTASAQTPFVDPGITLASEDGDPDVMIVRERFDNLSRIQSIYFRTYDGSPDRDVFSGTIEVSGADIVGLIYQRNDLKTSDEIWSPTGGDLGLQRGLEGDDVFSTIPNTNFDSDLIILMGDQIRFWLSTSDDIDDFRVLLQYPEQHAEAQFRVSLFDDRAPSPDGYPVTTPGDDGLAGGIIVGASDDLDLLPDDGDYGEVLSLERVRLKTEDLDIEEGEINLGVASSDGDLLGPTTVTLNNFAEGIDYDNDNGVDSNGQLSPIPNLGPLTDLQYQLTDFISEAGSSVPASDAQVLGIPETLANGLTARFTVSIQIPEGTPEGIYSSRLRVWEDNDGSRSPTFGEPSDRVEVRFTVSDGPIGDMGIGIDMSIADAGLSADGSLDFGADQFAEDVSFDMNAQDAMAMNDHALDDAASSPRFDEGLEGVDQEIDSSQSGEDFSSTDALANELSPPLTWTGNARGGGIRCEQSQRHSPSWYLTVFILGFLRKREQCQ